MSTEKHTPGPWFAEHHPEDQGGEFTIRASNGICVALSVGGTTTEEANARLIAATPDLLKALQSVWLWAENQSEAQSKGGHATFDLMMLREQRDIASTAIAKATEAKP